MKSIHRRPSYLEPIQQTIELGTTPMPRQAPVRWDAVRFAEAFARRLLELRGPRRPDRDHQAEWHASLGMSDPRRLNFDDSTPRWTVND